MTDVSLFRLYLLRATYLLIAIGQGAIQWPSIFHHVAPWSMMHGVAVCLLATVTILAAMGIRYPLQMLPVLFFELIWKALWLGVVAWPLWSAGRLDGDNAETAAACLMGIIVPFVIPWAYVYANYVKKPGERWR